MKDSSDRLKKLPGTLYISHYRKNPSVTSDPNERSVKDDDEDENITCGEGVKQGRDPFQFQKRVLDLKV